MNRTLQRRRLAMALGVVVLLASVAPVATSQEAPAENPFAAGDPGAKADAPVREQSIYIPYEKLREVFEKEGRGVFLPYERFRELWDATREKTALKDPQKPPVGALITEIENEATVAVDVVRVEARLKIEILSEGWHEIPLRLADAAITAATIDGQPARVVSAPKGYKLLVEKKGAKPEQFELKLEYAKAISRMPGQNSVSFEAPQAPVSRWQVTIPEAGVKVNLHPLIAATEVKPDQGGDPDAPPKAGPPEATTIQAFVGAAPTVRIDWTPKAEGAAGLEALASVQTEQQVAIDEGVVRTRALLAYTISRAKLAELSIEVPADQKVVNVFDANVRQWSVETTDGRQKVTVQLFEPAEGSQNVTIELERFTSEEEGRATLDAPVIKVLGVGRQQGVVVVRLSDALRAEATSTTGLVQIDTADLPGALSARKWAFSYRYAAVPFDLQLSVEKVQPRILVDSLVTVKLAPEGLSVDLLVVYTVQRAGVFRLELDIPAGYDVRQVRGREVAKAAAVDIDSHHLEGDDKTRLVVNLARKALGRVALEVALARDLDEFDLDKPSEKPAEIPLPIPQIATDTVQQAAGRLVVYAPESLRVNPLKTEGLRSISFTEAFEGMDGVQRKSWAGARPVLAFAFGQEPTSLSLWAQRRRPQVTIRQLLAARIDNGVVKFEDTLFYEVLYSGVESLLIDVPDDVAAGLRNETPGIRDKVLDPAPDDVTEGCTRWSLAGQTELIGSGQIKLVWEKKIEELDVGSSVEVPIPRLIPVGVDRAWGQIVLAKAETIDVHPTDESAGLRPIDPQYDLMPGAEVKAAAAAFEFHDDWKLDVIATRYELEEVRHTSIERAVLRMVVTRADKITVQALYRMRSARQRLVVKMPSNVSFDAEPRLDGRPVTLEIGTDGQYFVPLVDSAADESFLLEFRYTVPNDHNRLDCPKFPLEPAVQKVYLCAYVPDDYVLLDTEGPWTKEFSWRLAGDFNWVPDPSPREDELLRWVAGPIELNESFPTDGRLYVFSALRPEPSPAGSLELTTWDEDLVSLAVLAVVLIGGLLLVPAGTGTRMFMIGLLVIALVACGVFYPIFARQVLNGVLAMAVLIVLVVWVMWHFAWIRPRKRKRFARQRAALAPPASPFVSPEKAAPSAEEAPAADQRPIDAERVEESPPAGPQPPEGESPPQSPEDEPESDGGEEGGKTDA